MEKTDTFRQTNAYAMQYGVLLGVWGIFALGVYLLSLTRPLLSAPAEFLLVLSPFVAAALTIRFRQQVTSPGEGFTFGRGYVFCLLTGIYASVWIALAVYVYFHFFDGGSFCDALQLSLSQPATAELVAQMEGMGALDDLYAMSGAENMMQLIDAFRNITPESYAGMIISTTLISAPVISLLIGLLAMRRKLG